MVPVETDDLEYAVHEATYKKFVMGVTLFTAHVAVILLLMAYFLA